MDFNPVDDMYRTLSSWIFDKCGEDNNVEIEAKLGLLLANGEKDPKRITLPVRTATIIDSSLSDSHFQSHITKEVFKHLNTRLNNWCSNAGRKKEERITNLQNVKFPEIQYRRVHHVDKIYENHVRVTFDCQDPTRPKCIHKSRLDDREIFFPNAKFDARISISFENETCAPKEQAIECIRLKDRISYLFDIFSIDITLTHTYKEDITDKFVKTLIDIVNTKQPIPLNHGCEISYEAEIEIINMKKVERRKKKII